MDEGEFTAEIDRIMNLPVPSNLKILGFNMWNLWNLAGRPEEDKRLSGKKGQELQRFESTALVSLDGPRQAYYNIVEFKQAS